MRATIQRIGQSNALLLRAIVACYLAVFVSLDLQQGCVFSVALALACICLLVFSVPRPSGKGAIWMVPELLIACWAISFVLERGGGALLLTLPPLALVGLGRVRAASVSLALIVAAVAWFAAFWSRELPDTLDGLALIAGGSLMGLLNGKPAPSKLGASIADVESSGLATEAGMVQVLSDGTVSLSPGAQALLGYGRESQELALDRFLQSLPGGPHSAADAANYLRRTTLDRASLEFWCMRAGGARFRARLIPLDSPDFPMGAPAREQLFALRRLDEDRLPEQQGGGSQGFHGPRMARSSDTRPTGPEGSHGVGNALFPSSSGVGDLLPISSVGAGGAQKRGSASLESLTLAVQPQAPTSIELLVVCPETTLRRKLVSTAGGATIPVVVSTAADRDDAIDALASRRPDVVLVVSDGTPLAREVAQTLRGLQADANERECIYVALVTSPDPLPAPADTAFDEIWLKFDETTFDLALTRWHTQKTTSFASGFPILPFAVEKVMPGYLASRRELARLVAEAIEHADWLEAARAAHTLAGSPGFLGFELVRAACHHIESLARSPDPDHGVLRTHAELVREQLERAAVGE